MAVVERAAEVGTVNLVGQPETALDVVDGMRDVGLEADHGLGVRRNADPLADLVHHAVPGLLPLHGLAAQHRLNRRGACRARHPLPGRSPASGGRGSPPRDRSGWICRLSSNAGTLKSRVGKVLPHPGAVRSRESLRSGGPVGHCGKLHPVIAGPGDQLQGVLPAEHPQGHTSRSRGPTVGEAARIAANAPRPPTNERLLKAAGRGPDRRCAPAQTPFGASLSATSVHKSPRRIRPLRMARPSGRDECLAEYATPATPA